MAGALNNNDSEATRRPKAEQLRPLVEASPSAMLMIDPEGRIILVNRLAEGLFGYERGDLLGRDLETLIPPELRKHHDSHVQGFFREPKARGMGIGKELFGLRKNGTRTPVEIGLTPLETPEGPYTLASIIDVTERRQSEARLRKSISDLMDTERALAHKATELAAANEELARSNAALDEFAYVASHDLRAPLRDIDNLAQWIDEDLGNALPEKSARHFRILRSRIQRMENLLEDLLEYSRAGRVFGSSEELDVRSVLENVRELVGLPAAFTLQIPSMIPIVRTPRAPVEQIFRNLIGNAVKHHHKETGSVVVSAEDAGEFIRFAVADDGPGIPIELHERAFGMFQTLRPRDEVEGTGMGLALVKRLVEAHGGEIALESEEGHGATFHFTWPKLWPGQGS